MNHSLYIHFPFCIQRCHYCDFITSTGKDALIPAYIDALIEEFRIVTTDKESNPVHSIYFGGGTPSLLSLEGYEKLLSGIKSQFLLTDECEISLEANPGTLTQSYLTGLRAMGINRISIGVQSTDSFDLQRLDRIHDIDDILNAVLFARKAEFSNISLDMIFGLPWQDLPSWENSLRRAIDLAPEHFSLYSLIIEPGTPLYQWHQKGLISLQNQDLEGDMFEIAMELLEQAGYQHYEISNWAKNDNRQDFRCLHNLQYWFNKPYLGFGVGAHGYTGGIRTVNTPSIANYISLIKHINHDRDKFPLSPATISHEIIDKMTKMRDFMLLGLRLINTGASAARFEKWYGEKMEDVFEMEINKLLQRGLVEWRKGKQNKLCLTKRGVMVANQVFMEFV